MLLYIKREKKGINATCEYDCLNNSFIVKKGSTVSDHIAHSEKFRGSNTIEKLRSEYVKDNKVLKDVAFKSSSTAANFVTGCSSNGLKVWKNKEGICFKELNFEK